MGQRFRLVIWTEKDGGCSANAMRSTSSLRVRTDRPRTRCGFPAAWECERVAFVRVSLRKTSTSIRKRVPAGTLRVLLRRTSWMIGALRFREGSHRNSRSSLLSPRDKSVLSEFAAPTLEPGGLYVSAYPFRVAGISALSLYAVISHCLVLVTHTPLDVLCV